MSENLATYRIETSIEGMTVPGQKPGVGDRSFGFQMYIDSEDAEAANEIWYEHLKILLGDDSQAKLKMFAEAMRRAR